MKAKIQLAIICGGQSAEHEVSLVSAKNVAAALDKNKYELHVIVIQKNGEWLLLSDPQQLLMLNSKTVFAGSCVAVSFGAKTPGFLLLNQDSVTSLPVDIVFPVLHGSHGEDGTVQGLLELANIPYVGPGVLSSAVCMDKIASKALLTAAGIPVANYLAFNHEQVANLDFTTITEKLGLPFFVKPANTGSSVGISKVKSPHQFAEAVELALQYDHKILFEQAVVGREIECSVLGNETPIASLPGEVIPNHEFYSYEAKYIDPNGATLVIPADLPPNLINKVQETAKKAYVALNCEGMTRVDFFITPEQIVIVNEANTIPGFTQISMYPKMWLASGLAYDVLLDKLIMLARQRFQRDRVLVENRNSLQSLSL